MHFSTKSEEFMNYFLDDFNTFIRKKTEKQQKNIDRIIKLLFRKIQLANLNVQHKIKFKEIDRTCEDIVTKLDIPNSSLLDSHYVPSEIALYIQENAYKTIIYTTTVHDRHVEIKFILFDKNDQMNMEKYDTYIELMMLWLYMLPKNEAPSCNKTLKIFCYMTPFKKYLPQNQSYIIQPENSNSAVTTSCKPHGEILIFREEEWFKVFIHESFHVLGLDFSNMNCADLNVKLMSLFPISSDFNLHDAYAEFWATVINCCICAYQLIEDKKKIEDFVLYVDFCIQFEQIFSLFQMNKILNFIGISYNNLYSKNEIGINARKLYREKTSVFSYYIIKCMLLYHISDFFSWCLHNNENLFIFSKNFLSLHSLYNFIEQHVHDKNFIKDTNNMTKLLYNQYFSKPISTSMRMSICELSIKN